MARTSDKSPWKNWQKTRAAARIAGPIELQQHPKQDGTFGKFIQEHLHQAVAGLKPVSSKNSSSFQLSSISLSGTDG